MCEVEVIWSSREEKGTVCFKSFTMDSLELASSLTNSLPVRSRKLHAMAMHFSDSAAFPIILFMSSDGWRLKASFLLLSTWQRKIGSTHLEKLSGKGENVKRKGIKSFFRN